MDSKSQDSSALKQKFSVLGSGYFMSYMGRENQSINQSINLITSIRGMGLPGSPKTEAHV